MMEAVNPWLFFSLCKAVGREEHSLHLHDKPVHSCLLYGSHMTGKTSLLLQYASATASRGLDVLFIGDKEYISSSIGTRNFSEGDGFSSSQLSRLTFKYLQDQAGVQKYFAYAHLLRKHPKVVIVALHSLMGSENTVLLSKIMAIIQNYCDACGAVLILSINLNVETMGDSMHALSTSSWYFDCMCAVAALESQYVFSIERVHGLVNDHSVNGSTFHKQFYAFDHGKMVLM
eukprot:TRINITY_DN1618_c0_g1_i2.p1 TRINITY_DN1618_c0_g1~~TRINITY_DN1618_c0_g1_i2.p1  ORF type:complete len:231 (+),score=38.02 TRINITY_DN1618_c0_g1_i2:72-764(+)